jgi:histidinol-phosphatase (PHP family)
MLINYHIHTNTSSDAKGTIDEYCKKAVSLGFKEICFTNHHEFHDEKSSFFLTDEKIGKIISEIDAQRKKYPNLTIKFGVELGYSKEWKKQIVEFAKRYPFDYVLGSVHWIDDNNYADYKLPERLSTEERHKLYFAELNEMIRLGYCDCVGHLDVLHKNTSYLPFHQYKSLIDNCIESMKENNIGFEFNTRGWRLPNKDSYPNAEMLKLLYDSGIRKVTIGSDCHNPEDFADGIKRGLELLKQTGFKEIYTFSKRKAIANKI